MMILTVTENKALLSSDSIFLENTFLELWRGFLFLIETSILEPA